MKMNVNNKNNFLTLYKKIKKREIDLDTLDSNTIHNLLLLSIEEYKLRIEHKKKSDL